MMFKKLMMGKKLMWLIKLKKVMRVMKLKRQKPVVMRLMILTKLRQRPLQDNRISSIHCGLY